MDAENKIKRSYPSFFKRAADFLGLHLPGIDFMARFIVWRANKYNEYMIKKYADIHPSVMIGEFVKIDRNVSIGENTYINSYAQIFAADDARVTIGCNCAIGYNTHIKARTHHTANPTGGGGGPHSVVGKNIVIGDYVWLGDNVFIREGITIGSHSIVGANSVVTKNVEPYTVVGGIPARIIRRLNEKA